MDAPADDELATTRAAPVAWDLSPRWQRFFRGLAAVVGGLMTFGIFLLFLGLGSQRELGFPFVILGMLVPGLLCVLILHEGGHWLAARLAGMKTVLIGLGWLEFQLRRRGARLRWRKRPRGIGGYVIAHPDPKRDLRRSMMQLALGGPLMNLLAAAICGLIAIWLERSNAQAFWMLWALLHLSAGLLNLMPSMIGAFATDGLTWLRAWRNRSDTLPGATFTALHGQIVHGESFADFPAELLQRLAEEPEPMPLLHDWLLCQSALQRRDLDEAMRLSARIRACFDAYDASMKAELADLLVLSWAEQLYTHAWAERDPSLIETADLSSRTFWYAPHLIPRLRALAAALRGDRDGARLLLAVSRRYAEGAIESSLPAYEARLRGEIEALIDGLSTGSSSEHTTTMRVPA